MWLKLQVSICSIARSQTVGSEVARRGSHKEARLTGLRPSFSTSATLHVWTRRLTFYCSISARRSGRLYGLNKSRPTYLLVALSLTVEWGTS